MHADVVDGHAAGVLVTESAYAGLLVVGGRGRGGFAELVVGSTAVQVAAHAHCPVLVVRGTDDPTRPVMVGVDGSPSSLAAVEFAFAAAALRRVPLTALHVWPADRPWPPDLIEHGYPAQPTPDVVGDSIAGYPAKYPGVQVESRVVRGPTAAEALVSAHLRRTRRGRLPRPWGLRRTSPRLG